MIIVANIDELRITIPISKDETTIQAATDNTTIPNKTLKINF
jgi:hypothetical protein